MKIWRCITILNKEAFKNLNLTDLLVYNHKLWKESIKQYNEKSNTPYIKDKMLYRKIHCKIVADLSLDIFNDNISCFKISSKKMYLENILYFGCLTHDIKKYDKRHCTCGSNFIYEFLNNSQFCHINHIPKFENNIIKDICTIIKYHKSKGMKPIYNNDFQNSDINLLIFITRICDKLSELAIESRFKIIREEQVEKMLVEVLDKVSNDKEFYEYGKKIYNSVLEYFIRRYCCNKILNF